MFEAFIQYLISNNIPEYTVLVLLYLPIVATFVTFSRYILGWKSLSIYSTVLLVFALLELAHTQGGSFDTARGLLHGSIITGFITFVALGMQSITRELRLHYLSKVSIITAVVTSVVFFMLYIATELQAANFMRLSPMSFIIMILVLDIFVKSYVRKGHKKALLFIGNTIGLAFAIFIIATQPIVRQTVLAYPEITLFTIVINIFLGRWRQLRLSEYFRFKDINIKTFDDIQHDSEQK